MKTESQLDQMHDAVVARFPGGLTPLQFRIVTLESADDDDNGRVYPHSISLPGNPLIQHSLLVSMWMDDLVDHWDDGSGRPFKEQPARYRITDKGRAWLAEHRVIADGQPSQDIK